MAEAPNFYTGDPWFMEAVVTNEKTGAPAEPAQVTGVVYKPSEWDSVHEQPLVGAKGSNVTLTKTVTNHYENAVAVALTEPGIWRAILTSPEPFLDVQPVLITVKSTGEL